MQEDIKQEEIVEQVQKNFDEELLLGLRVDPNYNEPILHQVLRIAVYDEYHAYETYKKTIEKFGSIPPFSHIIEAEVRHYQALMPLLQKYNVPAPINDWADKIETPNSILEASEIGVAAEIDNVKMYDNLISYSKEYPDVLDTLYQLQAASYNNHLPAFRNKVAEHINSAMDTNDIYQNFSMHNIDESIAKMNEFSEMATKFAAGEVSQEDMLKVLGNTNLSFIGGALVGAIGAGVLGQIIKDKQSEEEI